MAGGVALWEISAIGRVVAPVGPDPASGRANAWADGLHSDILQSVTLEIPGSALPLGRSADAVNMPDSPSPAPASLVEAFQDSVRRFGGREAVRDSREALSYDALDRSASELAAELLSVAPAKRGVIGIYMDGGADYVVSVIAALKAGKVFLPLNTQFPAARLGAILRRARPEVVVTTGGLEPELSRKFHDLDEGENGATTLIVSGRPRQPVPDTPPEPTAPIPDHLVQAAQVLGRDPSDACYIVTTSGTTGEPKVILGSDGGLLHFVRWEVEELELDEKCRGSLLSPVTFDVSLRDIFVPLAVGGSLRIPDRDTVQSPGGLLDWLRRSEVDLVHIVPTLFRGLTRAIADEGPGPEPLPTLKWVLLAGEPVYWRDVRAWRSTGATSSRLFNLYGPSETTLARFYYPVPETEGVEEGMLPVGYPLPDTEALILQKGSVVGRSDSGEVFIGTNRPSHGYLGDEALTRASFPEAPNDSRFEFLYRTGDLGTLAPDGVLILQGRLDGQVKLYGQRIELTEVELRLRDHPDVRDAASAVRTDGSGVPRLVGYLVPRDGSAPSVESLRRHLGERLPDYMIPHFFVTMDALPLTHSGKLDRGALPATGRERPNLEAPYVPPRTSHEKDLATIWSEVLGIEQVGTRDGFFDLGGTSLLSVRLAERIRQVMGIEVQVARIFQFPTVASLAAYLSRGEGGEKEAHAETEERARRRRAAMSARRRRA